MMRLAYLWKLQVADHDPHTESHQSANQTRPATMHTPGAERKVISLKCSVSSGLAWYLVWGTGLVVDLPEVHCLWSWMHVPLLLKTALQQPSRYPWSTYIHTYMHAYIHAYMHTCIHTYIRREVKSSYAYHSQCILASQIYLSEYSQ